jgi:hypothetical protein
MAAIASAGVGIALFASFAETAAATPHGPRHAAPVRADSAAFTVPGSNGFSLDVESRRGTVRVVVSERRPPVATFSPSGAPRPAGIVNGAASIYRARAASTDPRRVEARLGQLGRISVAFHPSGRSRVTTLGPDSGEGCGGPTRIVRHLGTFRGTVEFQGEDGYTSVHASSAPGSVGTPLPSGCAAASRIRPAASGTAPAALLSAADRRAGARFEARTTGSGVAFTATWRERLAGGLVVSRRAYAGAPRGSFDFGQALTWAKVTPPAPFSGAARFGGAGDASWRGSLSATFPGGAIPMTGPGFHASLGTPR